MYAVEVRDHIMIAHSLPRPVFGPAQVTTQGDPKSRLRLERAQRVKAAHEQRGTTPPQEVLDVIARDGGPEPFHLRNRAR